MADADPDQPTEPGTPPAEVTPPAGEEAAPAPAKSPSHHPGGTTPVWWTWVGKHRKPVALVAVLAVVAAVAVYVVVSVSATTPEGVVRSYLDAIRSGDTDAALEIAGEPEEDGRVRFLSADAQAGDWSVEAVVERHVRETEADVDVTIRSGDLSRQGRFTMVKDDGGWRIESPFVKVDLTVGNVDVVELGGVRRPVKHDERGSVPLLLFPGVYDLYPSFTDRIAFDQPRFVAAPTESGDQVHRLTASYTLTDAGAETVQKAVNAVVDDCATQNVMAPPGCPFDISETRAIYSRDDVSDVAWTVVHHPDVYVARARIGSGVTLVVRKPGTVRVTGTGVPSEGPRSSFTLTCEFGLENLVLAVTLDGVTVDRVTGGTYSAALSTKCF